MPSAWNNVGVPASEFALLLDHTKNLMEQGWWDAAYLHGKRALDRAQSSTHARQLLQALTEVPDERRLRTPWAPLVALTAFRANAPEVCGAHVQTEDPDQGALRAWLRMLRGDHEGARLESEAALNGALAGIAWRMRAWALVKLRDPGWEDAYREAVLRNEGRQRGFCLLQLGAFLSYEGREAEARTAYAAALPFFKHDPELLANTAYNVGTACLRLRQYEAAEHAYQEAMRAARQPGGVRMLSRAWSGLGHVRRARAEFPRALHAYDMAQTKAAEPDDVAQAWRGKVHTLRLIGRLDEALANTYEGLERLGRPAVHGLYADLAALQTMLNDVAGAEQSLDRVPEGQVEEAQRAWVVRAELARRRGDLATATDLLRFLRFDALWTTEEARLFPELFTLLGIRADPVPPMRLLVRADGPVRALLNGLLLPLPSDKPAAALLALLALRGGVVAVESVLEGVTLPGGTSRLKRQNLSRVLGDLRDILGWLEAVQTDGRTLSLDRQLICEPLRLPVSAEDFCVGLHDEWIREWRDQHDELNLLLKS